MTPLSLPPGTKIKIKSDPIAKLTLSEFGCPMKLTDLEGEVQAGNVQLMVQVFFEPLISIGEEPEASDSDDDGMWWIPSCSEVVEVLP
jgi:hypothetical protein